MQSENNHVEFVDGIVIIFLSLSPGHLSCLANYEYKTAIDIVLQVPSFISDILSSKQVGVIYLEVFVVVKVNSYVLIFILNVSRIPIMGFTQDYYSQLCCILCQLFSAIITDIIVTFWTKKCVKYQKVY